MVKEKQLYINNSNGFYVLIKTSLNDTNTCIVESNWDAVAGRGPLILYTESIKYNFTLVANNYQPK